MDQADFADRVWHLKSNARKSGKLVLWVHLLTDLKQVGIRHPSHSPQLCISQVASCKACQTPGDRLIRIKFILQVQEKTGYSSDEGGMGSTYCVPGPPPTPTFSTTASPAAAAPAADGSDEERLVENICSRGGLRAQPDREALRLFVESLTNLSGSKVAHQLQHKIVSGPCLPASRRLLRAQMPPLGIVVLGCLGSRAVLVVASMVC